MATGVQFGDTLMRSATIDTNLEDKEGFACVLDTTDDHVINIAAGATVPLFVICEGGNGSSDSLTGSFIYGGRAQAKYGGTVTQGNKLTSNGDGEWIATSGAGEHFGAIAVESGVDGDLKEVIVTQGVTHA